MTTKAQHTPTPWAVSNSGGSIQVSGMRHPATICILEKSPLKITPEVEANARHIVKCVNLHDELVGALKALRHEVICALLYKKANKGLCEDMSNIIEQAITRAEEG